MDESSDYRKTTKIEKSPDIEYGAPKMPSSVASSLEETLGFPMSDLESVSGRSTKQDIKKKPSSVASSLEEMLGWPMSDLESVSGRSTKQDIKWYQRLMLTVHRSNEIRLENVRLSEQLDQRNSLLEHFSRTRRLMETLPPVGAILVGLMTFVWSLTDKGMAASIAFSVVIIVGVLLTLFPAFITKTFKAKEKDK